MKKRILNTEIEFAGYAELKQLILAKAVSGEKYSVTYANSHVCISALNNTALNNSICKFDLVHPDGIAVHAAHKFLYRPGNAAVRVNGTDLYEILFKEGEGLNCFILGSSPAAAGNLNQKKDNKLKICGQLSDPDDGKAVGIINNSGADILFVALGTPIQEQWIINNRDAVNIPVIMATGSGIDIISGKKNRAPLMMRKAGLEWLFRLFSEPGRLWKRYLIMNPVFIFKVIVQKLKLNQKHGNT